MTWSIPDRRRYLEDAKRTIEKSILRLQESCPHENKQIIRDFPDQEPPDIICKDCGKVFYEFE